MDISLKEFYLWNCQPISNLYFVLTHNMTAKDEKQYFQECATQRFLKKQET